MNTSGPPLSESPQELDELVQTANQTLVRLGAESAEQSFGLGCLLGGLLLLGAVVGLYFAGILPVIMALIVLVLGAIGLTGTAALLAGFARKRRIRDTYHVSVHPEIERYLKKNDIARVEFDRQAAGLLASDDPLLAFLQPPPLEE